MVAIASRRPEQVDQHEIVNDPGEHQHCAREDGRGQHRQQHPAH